MKRKSIRAVLREAMPLTLVCVLGFYVSLPAQSPSAVRNLLIRVHGGEGQLVPGAQVSVRLAFGRTIPAGDQGDGTYRAELPRGTGSCTVEAVAEGFQPTKMSVVLSNQEEIQIYLLREYKPTIPGPTALPSMGELVLHFDITGRTGDGRVQPIGDATLVLTITQGTSRSYRGQLVGSGRYQIRVPASEQGKQATLQISASDYESKTASLLSVRSGLIQAYQLLHNDYGTRYTVDRNRLVESFGQVSLLLDGPTQAGQISMDFVLPFGREMLYRDGRYPNWHYVTNYQYRERLYHDLLKEIALQSTAEATLYGQSSVTGCVEELARTLGTSDLDQVLRQSVILGKYFGQPFVTDYGYAWGVIKGSGLVVKVNDAARSGALGGLLLSVAYGRFQEESYGLLGERARGCVLSKDPAFQAAFLRLKGTLTREREQRWKDLATRLRNKNLAGVAAAEFVSAALSALLSKALYLAAIGKVATGVVGFVISEVVLDIMQGTAKRGDLESSLLLLAAIEHHVLGTEIDGYEKPVPAYNQKVGNGDVYGGLERLHAGHLVNAFRSSYYSGKGQGFTQELLGAIRSNPYARAIIEEGDRKARKASADYRVLSATIQLGAPSSKDEEFMQFVGRFFSDPSFHYQRVRYPLAVTKIEYGSSIEIVFNADDTEWKAFEKSWQIVTRKLDFEGGGVGEEYFKNQLDLRGNTADLRFIYWEWGQNYLFQRDRGMWYLVAFSADGVDFESLQSLVDADSPSHVGRDDDDVRKKCQTLLGIGSIGLTPFDLNGDGIVEYVVERSAGGTNQFHSAFHVFKEEPFREILRSEPGKGLRILASTHGGYRDITVLGHETDSPPRVVYQWNGTRYVATR